MALSMKALSSAVKALRVSFSSSRSAMRRLSKASCSRRLPSWYMMLSGMASLLQGAEPDSRKLAEAAKLGKRPGASLRSTTAQACERSYGGQGPTAI